MKLVCDRQELFDALALTNTVISSRPTKKILQSVCVVVEPGSYQVLATDLEVGLRVRCRRMEADGVGRFLLDGSKAASIVRELNEDRIEITVDSGLVTLRGGDSVYRLVADESEAFPVIPEFEPQADDQGQLSVPNAVLVGMIRRTVFAAAREATRYALNGVLFEQDGAVLRLVATDGKRLAICEQTLDGQEGVRSRVVSTKAVQLLARLAGPEDEVLLLKFTENQLLARSERAVLSAQLVQGHFPPYNEVIPQGLDKSVEFDTPQLASALRRAALLTTKDSSAVSFLFQYNKLTLRSRAPGVGEGEVEMPVVYEYDPVKTAFNPQYLIEALKVVDSPRVTIKLKDNSLPSMICEGETFRYIVMPLDLS